MVESIVPDFGDDLNYEKVITRELEGATKYKEISKNLGRPAPVPSIFIEGELVFERTPGQEQLRTCLKGFLEKAR